ncbi:aldose epimerase family protein [uncultured Draconibacterium sp.]|uniref:aldose epimerase family protein n=1 Tax=uncultured Draconibacterium sp. TaxID=1573823 RepID=UPI003217C726
MKYLSVFILALLLWNCSEKKAEFKTISEQDFNTTYKGEEVKLYTLENSNGLICQLTNFGARVVSLYTPDKDGNLGDVVVGYGTGDDFINKKENFFGAIIGRYGNRIGEGRFVIDETEYLLEKNDGANHLHGGSDGFHRQVWTVENQSGNEITFSLLSPDMAGGYPGNVQVQVKYQLTDANELEIEYFAETDKATVLNLTNHTYFNLTDAGKSSINDHKLTINADYYTPVDGGLIPTGELAAVAGTPFDFTTATAIGDRVNNEDEQLVKGKGYDHNWVLNTNNDIAAMAAKVEDPVSGRVMEVYTIEPGIQFYGGNFLDGTIEGKYGISVDFRGALCLETQHFPDSPNKPEFPSVKLMPGEKYHSLCIYKFK